MCTFSLLFSSDVALHEHIQGAVADLGGGVSNVFLAASNVFLRK